MTVQTIPVIKGYFETGDKPTQAQFADLIDTVIDASVATGVLTVPAGGTGVATLTGIAKGNGASAFTAAVAGTDYYAPGGTDIPVTDGGTGRSDSTAYAVLCGGTTSTAPHQSIASVGTVGQVLTSNGAGALPTFQAAGTGGKLLQVIQTSKTDTFSTTSAIYTDVTGLSVTITPSSASSRIFILAQVNYGAGGDGQSAFVQLVRNSTAINIGDAASNRVRSTFWGAPNAGYNQLFGAGIYVDSPATTSATTYKFQIRRGSSGTTAYVNRTNGDSDTADYGRPASSIIVMEIGA